jgi:D-methionine transport system substrate-binding protein
MIKALISASLFGAIALAAPAMAQTKLSVGASYVPHAEILEQAKPILAKEGIDLIIVPFQDYILPNTALASGEIDANYFQHVPYQNSVLADHKNDPTYDFVNAGGIHIEPIGIYSKRVKKLSELPQGIGMVMAWPI